MYCNFRQKWLILGVKNADAIQQGPIQDSYRSISDVSEGLFKDKGSRFIAYAYPVCAESQVKPLVDVLKKEHHGARHHCFAYRIGCEGSVWRANDDGEPSGSAGKPILGAIDSAGLSDVLVVVVRYFGGILLGVPGLVRAYRQAAADALEKAAVVEKTATKRFLLEFDYLNMNEVQTFLKAFDVQVLESRFDLRCEVTLAVRLSLEEKFIDKINNINNEKCTCIQCRPL